jgi:hypothetical protein
MGKPDLEFYEIAGIEGKFVSPPPESDPYHGAYNVAEIPDLALEAIAGIVSDHVGPAEIHSESANLEDFGGYFFETATNGCIVVPQKAEIKVQLGEEAGYYSNAMADVIGVLSEGPGEITLPLQRDPLVDRKPARPVAKREYGAILGDAAILDEQDQPIHPSILLSQAVLLRAYRLLPDLESMAGNGKVPLVSSYNLQPVKLAAAQIIRITGINPLVSTR